MRKAILFGFALACVTTLSFLSITPLERRSLNPDGSTSFAAASKPSQVEVTNFPAVQAVSGSVNVGNLPAVQTVAGTVSVANLPLDGNGHVLVAIQNIGSGALVLHSTTATYQGDLGGRTGATQKCQAEFPGSHFASAYEVFNASGTGNGSPTRGIVWLTSETLASWVDQFGGGSSCGDWLMVRNPSGVIVDGPGLLPRGGNINSSISCDQALPILCAE